MDATAAELGGALLYLALVVALAGAGSIFRTLCNMLNSTRRRLVQNAQSGRGNVTMARKLIVIAESKEAGEAAYPTASVVVTPRSPHGARGMSGAKVIVMAAMRGHEKLDELLAEVAPATSQLLGGHPSQVETVVKSKSKPIVPEKD